MTVVAGLEVLRWTVEGLEGVTKESDTNEEPGERRDILMDELGGTRGEDGSEKSECRERSIEIPDSVSVAIR